MRILFTSVIILFCIVSSAQNGDFKKKFDQSQAFMAEGAYDKALPLLLELDALDQGNANVNFRIGECYLHSLTHKADAVTYLQDAILATTETYNEESAKERKAPQDAYYQLGRAYHFAYKFDEAIEALQHYKTLLKGKTEAEKQMLLDVDKEIEYCENGKSIMKRPQQKMEIINLKAINSPYDEYAPLITADEATIIFTSRREGSTGGKTTEEGKYYEDVYTSEKVNGEWNEPVSIGTNINTVEHDASIALSVDGQTLLTYKDDLGDGNIYISKLIGDIWTAPVKMGTTINSKAWEPSASISADGQTLYFVSDRSGGFGGRDIYRVKKLPNGEWSRAENLGSEVNTSNDEDAPYIHPDGVTLFFSSQGHKSMGGFDIFVTNINEEGNWTEAYNIGAPINTTGDDVFYVPSADGKRAYYSSFKADGVGGQDLYLIKYPDAKEIPLTVIKGTFKDADGSVPDDATITVTDITTSEIQGIYKPNSKTGKFLFILEPGKNYSVTYEANDRLFKSENLNIPQGSSYREISNPITLAPIKVGAKVTLNNIFYDFDKASLRSESQSELDKLYELMVNNSKMVIEIASHTDAKGTDEYNLKLSQERSKSVVAYLVSKKIEPARLVAKGYGESKPIADNNTEEGMQLNRRTELTILKTE